MLRDEIIIAIEKARDGIGQYLEIMSMVPEVDVSEDKNFQRRFNHFYRIRQRSEEWYSKYYALMETSKVNSPAFDDVLDHIQAALCRYEPSFSSKLVATLNPSQPVWDKYVLEHTCQKAPAYSSPRKFDRAKHVYRGIQQWFSQCLESSEGRLIIDTFNELIPEHVKISDIKKIDFVLWQTRS